MSNANLRIDYLGEWHPLGGLGTLVVTAGLYWLGGALGLVAGGVIALAWWRLQAPLTLAVGHTVALAVVPVPIELQAIVVLEAGFAMIAVVPLTTAGADRLIPTVVLGIAGLGLISLAWAGWHSWTPRWLVGAALVLTVVIAGYGIHRYEVVAVEYRAQRQER